MKYTDTMVTFSEVPDEISLCINISGCPNRCPGCHSPELWEDIGTELNEDNLTKLINKNEGITCVCFMGGDADPEYVRELASFIKSKYDLKTCWYSGKTLTEIKDVDLDPYDYIKVGPYDKKLGGLDSPIPNQRFFVVYKVISSNSDPHYELKNITNKFWKNEQSNS